MKKIAIRYNDLVSIAKKHKIGKTDAVLLNDAFFDEVFDKAYKNPGVGRCNDWDIEADGCSKFEAARNRVNSENRYCKTKQELCNLLGLSRATLYRWENGIMGRLQKIFIPEKGWRYYDAMAVLARWEKALQK